MRSGDAANIRFKKTTTEEHSAERQSGIYPGRGTTEIMPAKASESSAYGIPDMAVKHTRNTRLEAKVITRQIYRDTGKDYIKKSDGASCDILQPFRCIVEEVRELQQRFFMAISQDTAQTQTSVGLCLRFG